MKGLILVLQFTTRLPIPLSVKTKEGDLAGVMKYMPLAGGIIGAAMWFLYRVLLNFDPFVAAVAAVIFESVITGGLHQDGLADTFDGLCSNRDREGMLDAMKDSRLGTHGVLALTGAFFLKVALINALGKPEALLVMPVFSRLAMVYGAAFSESARASGLGFVFIKGTTGKDVLIASLIALSITLYPLGLLYTAAMMAVVPAVSLMFIRLCTLRIGGMTGDTLGALGETVSLVFLSTYGVFLFYFLC
ncbi:MAG: adenosylcobinamide-GDP ribazoletransferase [Firmicutes bacterium]|nr:adenosylcobinamide-GDP ribazoletransferase [Bacillota bacterium]MDD3298257.1 adenosylcobinamide-GDP ribazoletransferase [Bacillota bacterium]MDD3851907.1 adenosylcobinamide-GDP ribazoletransferase [Bacillota bacterium]